MKTDDPVLRSIQARVAALTRAARTDGSEISAPARKAFMDRFEVRHECKLCGVIEIDQTLPPRQRQRAVQAAITAHFTRLARRTRVARNRAARASVAAEKVKNELAEQLAEIDNAS